MSINRLVSSSDKYFLQQISNNTKTSGADNIKSNTPVATQSTLQSVGIYGRDPTDTWKSLKVDANGVLAVDLSIDETSLATSALQTTGNASLTSLDSKVVLPVALTGSGNLKCSIEEGSIPAITGFSTSAKQDLMLTDLGVIKGDTTSLDSKITACNTGAVVVSSSALPTGATLEATQLLVKASVASIDTKVVLPVALSNGFLKVSIQEGQVSGGSTESKQDANISSLATILGQNVGINANTLKVANAISVSNEMICVANVTASVLPTLASTSTIQATQQTSLTSIDSKLILPASLTGSGNLKCAIEEGSSGGLTKVHTVLYNNGTGTAGTQSIIISMGQRTNLSVVGSTSSSGAQVAVAYLGVGGIYNTNSSYASLLNISGTYHFAMTVTNIGSDSCKLTFLTTCNNLNITTSTY